MNLKNKNDLALVSMIIFVIIVIVIAIITILGIWIKPNENKNEDIFKYSYSGFENKIITKYSNRLKVLLKEENVEYLIKTFDEKFLADNSLTKNDLDGIKKFLNDNELLTLNNATIVNYTVSKNLDTGVYVYRFKYYNKYGAERYLNLIETEPYVYTISMEQVNTPTSAKNEVDTGVGNIDFVFTILNSTVDSIEYNVEIINNSNDIVKFDFNNILSAELNLEDGTNIKLGTVITSDEDEFTLLPNGILNQYLFFPIPLDQQGNIETITFYNVTIGDTVEELKVNL